MTPAAASVEAKSGKTEHPLVTVINHERSKTDVRELPMSVRKRYLYVNIPQLQLTPEPMLHDPIVPGSIFDSGFLD